MFKRFIHYYHNHKLIFTLDMIAAFLIAVTGVAYPIITREMLKNVGPGSDIKWIFIGGGALLGIYVIRMALRFFVQYYGHIMGVAMQGEMRTD